MTIPAEERTPYTDAPPDDSGYNLRPTRMAAVTAGLERVLTRLALDPKKLILIIEAGPTEEGVREAGCLPGVCLRAYVQWLLFPDGSFVSEVASSASLDPAHSLTDDQDRQLLDLGWSPPEPPGAPNYFRVSLSPRR